MLMSHQVYLPAISGILPTAMVQTIADFMEFCYIMRRSVIDEQDLRQADNALTRFEEHRQIFQDSGVRPDGFSIPRMHALRHYFHHVRDFAAPNGLCSSITEAKHIKAVKEPWRRSNRYNAIDQILLTNQRLDKLAASRADFEARGMLSGSSLSAALLSAAHDHDENGTIQTSLDIMSDTQPTAPLDDPFSTMQDQGPCDGPRALSSVVLARSPGMLSLSPLTVTHPLMYYQCAGFQRTFMELLNHANFHPC